MSAQGFVPTWFHNNWFNLRTQTWGDTTAYRMAVTDSRKLQGENGG